MSDQPTILITGGAGFIGSHVADRFLAEGCRVRLLDDLSTGKPENIVRGAEFVEGSVVDPDAIGQACQGVEAVVHLAAEVSVPRSMEDPAGCVERNVVGTQRVIDASRAAGVRRIVFASTAAVYGDQPEIPSREPGPLAPYSPYAATKLAGEHLLHCSAMSGGPSAACLRFFNVYGPRQDGASAYSGVISAFLTARATGRQPKIFGDGSQSRDFVSVFDVARAVWLASQAELAHPAPVMNIGTGQATTLLELASAIEGLADPEFHPARAGDVRHSLPDVAQSEKVLGFRASIPLVDGLQKTAAWYDQQSSSSGALA